MEPKQSKAKKDDGGVRIPDWLRRELVALQIKRWQATGRRPSYGELLAERWNAAASLSADPAKVVKMGKRELAEVERFRDFVLSAEPADLAKVMELIDLLGFRRHYAEGKPGNGTK